MYYSLLLLLFLYIGENSGYAQIEILNEDFNNQDFQLEPVWTGDIQNFIRETDNDQEGNHLLRLNAAGAGVSILSTSSEAAYGVWELFIRQDFTPSNSNFSYIFLIADRPDLNGPVNGYALRTGESGSPKRFRLYRFTNGEPEEIMAGETEIGAGDYTLRVERSFEGEWKLFVSGGFDTVPILDSMPVIDNTHRYSSHFGLMLQYTSTRADKFYFDNLKILADLVPFQVIKAEIANGRNIEIFYNHGLSPNLPLTGSFVLNETLSPNRVEFISPNGIAMIFNDQLADGTYNLQMSSVTDRFGNIIDPDAVTTFNVINPFVVEETALIEERMVQIRFSELLNPESVTGSSFLFEQETLPVFELITDREGIMMVFSENLPPGDFRFFLRGIESESGWIIKDTTEVIVFRFDRAEQGDILISEFMYDPPAGYSSYVEIQNRSEKFINLRDWRLQRRQVSGEGERKISVTDLLFSPGEFLVISGDTASLKQVFGERNWHQLDNFPRFNIASPDEIRLFSNEDDLYESLEYIPSTWGGREVALERKSADVRALYPENWGESLNPLLGTPGLPNEVEPDLLPPVFERLEIGSDERILLTFSERVNSSTAGSETAYEISPNPGIQMIAIENNMVHLFPASPLVSDTEYTITVREIEDIFGNKLENESRSVRFFEFGQGKTGDLIINEIMYMPESGMPEFIEIYNKSEQFLSLENWILESGNNKVILSGSNGVIRPEGFFILTELQIAGLEYQLVSDRFPALRNSGDTIVLRNSEGIRIDSLSYLPEWGGNRTNVSLERVDPSSLSVDPANWKSSISEAGSTPGKQNSVFEIDNFPPSLLFALWDKALNRIEVRFSEFVNPGSETRFSINNMVLGRLQFDGSNRSVLYLNDISFDEETEQVLAAENISDFQGNISQITSIPIARPSKPADLAINEIMFDPIKDNFDNLPDQSEYIEIINRRNYTISVEGIVLHDEPDENGEVRIMTPVTTVNKFITPKSFLLLYPDNSGKEFSESGLAAFFALEPEKERYAIRFDRSTLGLTLSGRSLFLADHTLETIDMVEYSGSWHNPNLPDTKGISLERISPELDSNDASNWGSSATDTGGTPLGANSLFQNNSGEKPEAGISFDPNPFSPDGDGNHDTLFINYKLDEPDYMVRVRIFDRYGRLVRRLAEKPSGGFEGTLLWDGHRDSGERNRIGVYIVYFEAFNSANGNDKVFKELVVLARNF